MSAGTHGPSLFRRLLGNALELVPAPLRALHEAGGTRRYEGRARVRAAEGLVARRVARMTGLPTRHGEMPIAVAIEPDGEGEIWTREFPRRDAATFDAARPMRTRLSPDGALLREEFGPVTLHFRLEADADGIVWHPVDARAGGMALPVAWVRGIHARESLRDGCYAFDVGARLPMLGHLVAYEGWLDVE